MSGNNRGRKRQTAVPMNYILVTVIFIIITLIYSWITTYSKDPAAEASPSPAKTASAAPTPTPLMSGGVEYTAITKTKDEVHLGKLILVSKEHPYKFLDSASNVNISEMKTTSYRVSDNTLLVGKDTIGPLNALFDAYYKSGGVSTTYVISAFRTFERQQELYNQEVADKGVEEGGKWVAMPGTSEHHTGLAVDLGIYDSAGAYHEYDGSGIYSWINQNSYKYGFVVRYTENKKSITNINPEPWHFRYLGIPHATQISKLKLCLEEYIDLLRGYSYTNPMKITSADGGEYLTYYCSGLTVYVPKTGSYEVSGNNVDGFIVTLKVS